MKMAGGGMARDLGKLRDVRVIKSVLIDCNSDTRNMHVRCCRWRVRNSINLSAFGEQLAWGGFSDEAKGQLLLF